MSFADHNRLAGFNSVEDGVVFLIGFERAVVLVEIIFVIPMSRSLFQRRRWSCEATERLETNWAHDAVVRFHLLADHLICGDEAACAHW